LTCWLRLDSEAVELALLGVETRGPPACRRRLDSEAVELALLVPAPGERDLDGLVGVIHVSTLKPSSWHCWYLRPASVIWTAVYSTPSASRL
jgi:hypothetical protein